MNRGDARGPARRGDLLALGGLLLVIAVLTLPAILTGQLGPTTDVAQVIGVGSEPETSVALQVASVLVAFALGAVLYAFARRRMEAPLAFLVALPVVVSPGVLGNAIWMMTDNLSLALIALAIGSAAFGTTEAGSRLVQGAAAGLAVATRPINLWLLAPIAASWWLGGRRRTGVTIVAMLAPLIVFGVFIVVSKSAVPPRFSEPDTNVPNPAAIGVTLTLTAAYGLCLLPLLQRAARELLLRPGLVIAVAVTGALLAAAGPSVGSDGVGGNGGWLWRAAADLPTIAGRSPMFLFGGSAGLLVLVMLFMEIEPRGQKHAALVLLAAFAGCVAAHVATVQIVQGSDEAMVLLTLVWLTVCLPPSRRVAFCLGLLAAQQLLFSAVALYAPMLR